MALDVRIGSISLKISQVLPATKPDPNSGSETTVSFFGGNCRTFANIGLANGRLDLGQTASPVAIIYRPGTADALYPQTFIFAMTIVLDGEPSTFYLKLSVTKDVDGRKDVLTWDQAGQTVSSGTNTIKLVGLRRDTDFLIAPSVDIPENRGEFKVRFELQIVESVLQTGTCEPDGLLFAGEPCDCEPICKPIFEDLVDNCEVLPPLPPVVGCVDIPVVPPGGIVDPPLPGEGSPGPPGPPGPPGTDGQDGEDGCVPIIIWTRGVVYTSNCSGPSISINVVPFGQCNYWVHFITYYCLSDYYSDRNCCDFIYCNGQWEQIPDYANPYNEGRLDYGAMGQFTDNGSGCTPGTLWTMATMDAEPIIPPGAIQSGSSSLGYTYYSVCADYNPGGSYTWYNATPSEVADIIGDANFLPGSVPNCCLPPGGVPPDDPPGGDPCNGISPPSSPGQDGEVIRKCICPDGTTCEPAGTLWVIRLDPGDPDPPIGIWIGYGINDDGNHNYFATCAETQPPDHAGKSWQNTSSECVAYFAGDAFQRVTDDPICCDPHPTCDITTGSPTTISPTTTVNPGTTTSPGTTGQQS